MPQELLRPVLKNRLKGHCKSQTSPRVSFALPDETTKDILSCVRKKGEFDDRMDYKAILQVFQSPDVTEETLINWLTQLSENISVLDHENEHLVGVILKLQWTDKSKKLTKLYTELILHLVTAHTFYLRPVLKMIIDTFISVKEADLKPNLVNLSQQKYLANVHKLLPDIVRLVPTTSSLLVPMLAKSFPFLRRDAVVQVSFAYNMLEMTKYLPHLRREILELLIKKILQIDVHCTKCDIEDAEANADESVFPMEEDVAETDVPMKHPLANVLDLLMQLMFDHVDSVCKEKYSSDLDWDATKKLYKDLLAIFDTVVLPTYASAHVQFLMFYVCSFRQALCEGYIDYLWKKVQNPSVSPFLRQTTAFYIGSLLSRAKYVSISMTKDCILLMTKWINSYIDNQDGSSQTFVDVVHHGTFYAVCQTIFYVVAFRHKELVEARKGMNFLRSLNLDRIVACRLNPLKVCLPTVVKNFANITRNYQIAYCYTIIERNNRMLLPTVQDNSSAPSSSLILDVFFPFDPYLLKRSGTKIEPIYRIYDKQEEEMQVDKEDEDDFLPEHSSSEKSTIVQDFLSYGTSPGFKQIAAPQFR